MGSQNINWEEILMNFSKNNDVHEKSNELSDKQINETVSKLSNIIGQYRVSGPIDNWNTVGKDKVEETIRFYLNRNEPIRMVLPAFPFKSPNDQNKVISKLPDLASELALKHLNGLAFSMSEIYSNGVYILIIPDGLVYNDILNVNDKDVWNYSNELQKLIKQSNLDNLCFVPLYQIFSSGQQSKPPTCDEYCILVKDWRKTLFTEWIPKGYSVDEEIKNDPDSLATYRGYCKFLALDMAKTIQNFSSSKRRSICSSTAKEMILSGKCFSRMVATIPNHIRLSIHPCENSSKISISLFPGKSFRERTVTPWHNAVILDTITGLYRVGSSGLVDSSYSIVQKDKRSWYLCNFPIKLSIKSDVELLYPHGLKIKCQNDCENLILDQTDYQKIQDLLSIFGMIVMEGFDKLEPGQFCRPASSSYRFSSHERSSSESSSSTSTEASSINSFNTSITTNKSSRSNSITIEEDNVSHKFVQMGLKNKDGEMGLLKAFGKSQTVILKEKDILPNLSIVSLRLASEHLDGNLQDIFCTQNFDFFRGHRHAYFPKKQNHSSISIMYDSEQCLSNI